MCFKDTNRIKGITCRKVCLASTLFIASMITYYVYLNLVHINRGYCDVSEEKNKALRILIKTVSTAFEIYNITYWVDYGTALGAYRYCDVIPWDHDADISYLDKDYNKVKKAAEQVMKEKGFYMNPFLARYRNQQIDMFSWKPVRNWISVNSVYKWITLKDATAENYHMHRVTKPDENALKMFVLNIFVEHFPAIYLSNRSRVQISDFWVYTTRNITEFVKWRYYFTFNKVLPYNYHCLSTFYYPSGGTKLCMGNPGAL